MANIHLSDRKSGARRNLNESFNESNSFTSPIQNYSIVSPDESEEINDLKLRMRKSLSSILKNKSISELSKSLKNNLQIDKANPYVDMERLSIKQPSPELKKNTLNQNVLQLNNSQKLRRSTRTKQRISYVDLISPPKTPKRNRKYSTSSESSSVAGVEYLTPSKKANIQISDKLNTKTKLTRLENSPKRSTKKDAGLDSDDEQMFEITKESTTLGKKYGSNLKHSTPVDNILCTPGKRNSIMPAKYLDYCNDISPTKKKKTEVKECFVNLSNSVDIDKSSSPTAKNKSSRINPTVKLNNLNTPKKTVCSHSENEINTALRRETQQFSNMQQTPKTVKYTPSAKAKLIREGIVTPSVQARGTPLQKNCTPLNKARAKLHVSYLPDLLPCRGKEYENIFNFLEGKLLDGCGGCMYISGVPGTGKTATVTDVLRKLEEKCRKTIPDFQSVSINGMKLSEPRQSYVEILKQLTGKTLQWEQAQLTLDNLFTKKQGSKSKPIILLVDELDILCTKRQDVVYNLLDWPTRASVQLIVITIANTMDLPERLLMGRVTSRLGLTRLTFQAYTHKQLQEIVTMRLIGTKVFNPDAVQLVARKVASVSGDARRALDICRRAAEIAESEGKNTLVSMNHVNEALNAMITQPKVKAIKYCSRLQQLILQAVVAEVERTGVEETTFSDVYRMFECVANINGFQKVSCTLALAAVAKLGACRLLLTDQKLHDFHQKLILNVSTDDVYYALKEE
ncbi:cell division control protein 6-related [Holotrichia oblita]|uniref:Cell division control protein 6-related n=1 Tax=Holotrichia oblita TaxID=644536 RepID=A0ACB9TLL8_HOLOL|nr:cell division control protein 6-related [Holotrichia oblita]